MSLMLIYHSVVVCLCLFHGLGLVCLHFICKYIMYFIFLQKYYCKKLCECNTVHIIILINLHACCSSIFPFLSIFCYFPVLFFLLYFSFPAFYIVLFCLSMLATTPIQVIHSTATASSLPLSFVLTICKHVTFFLYSPKTAGPCSSMEFSLFTYAIKKNYFSRKELLLHNATI